MPSLMELVERVNKGELIDSELLEVYQESPNSAEKFLAHHAHAMLDLRRAHQHMLQSLEAIDYSDQKVLSQFISVSQFLGLTDMRASPVVQFGASAIARREYPLGLEAIQNGVAYDLTQNGSYTADRENCALIATQYERVAQSIGWTPPAPMDWNNKQTKIAYIVSSISDDEATGKMLASLGKYHDGKRFKMQVYVTESAVRRERSYFPHNTFVPASTKRGQQVLETLAKNKVPVTFVPLEGDLTNAVRELANQLIRDKTDVAIFDATQADPVACVVANWPVARVKINMVRKSPMYVSSMHTVMYVDQAKWEIDKDFWSRKGIESRHVMEGVDIDETLSTPPQRGAYGIPDQAVVLATAGNELDRTMSEEFVDTVINVLRAHPHAIYLLVGDGELNWQKRRFESAGVGKRVGYTGRRKDLPGFMRLCDLYLAEFPCAGSTGVLQAMSVERPVVAMKTGDNPDQSVAATLAGSECTITGRDSGAYIERVSKMIREPAYRTKLGKTMKTRVEQHFAYNQTARSIEQICDQLIQQNTEVSINMNNQDPPIAQVA